MPSQFFGLNIAYSALLSSNAALNTTANNIANEETPGYSKQVVVTQASDALRTFAKYGCAGAGVDTLAVERLRNEYYDVRFWKNNSNVGEFEVKDDYMRVVEDYFRDDNTAVGFNTIFGSLYDSLEEFSKHAGDATFKQAVSMNATSLTDYFNAMYAGMQKTQKDLNAEMKATVDQINSYAEEIASLNKQINVIELSGTNANELRDQRGKIVDKLSRLVSVETQEFDVNDPNNPDRDTGATKYIVKIAGGQNLVSGTNYNTLICTGRSNTERQNQSDIDGLYDITWSNGNRFDLHNASIGGTLKGIIDMRDGNNGEYFHGIISSIGQVTHDDGKSYQTVTVDVSADYLKNLNKSNLAEYGKIRLFDQEVLYDNFTFSYDAAKDTYSYTFEMRDPNTALNSSKIGKEASVGVANSYQGIPYYMQQMSEWLRDYAEAFNTILTQEGAVDGYGSSAVRNLFVANNWTDETQYDCTGTPDRTGSYTINSRDNTYYKLTAGSAGIDRAIDRDAALLASHTSPSAANNEDTAGQDKDDIVMQLIDLHTNKEKMSFRGCSAEEFLQCILSDVTLNKNAAETLYDKYDDLGNNIDNLRLSVSGVDKDEEGVDLVKFQNAYTLASKMINCFTEIYDRLILQTGV
ncbi:MAG: flagellar hook-associated protein FlgK [Clostridium sp.]|nr:flagellar hook-associated protein FlgK [Clostridium sp.]